MGNVANDVHSRYAETVPPVPPLGLKRGNGKRIVILRFAAEYEILANKRQKKPLHALA
jgi:hypothetical protein